MEQRSTGTDLLIALSGMILGEAVAVPGGDEGSRRAIRLPLDVCRRIVDELLRPRPHLRCSTCRAVLLHRKSAKLFIANAVTRWELDIGGVWLCTSSGNALALRHRHADMPEDDEGGARAWDLPSRRGRMAPPFTPRYLHVLVPGGGRLVFPNQSDVLEQVAWYKCINGDTYACGRCFMVTCRGVRRALERWKARAMSWV